MATPHTIAVAGKGGVGKTTTCGMIIDYLCKKQDGPILVVDADANSNLNEVLGVEVETTLGSIREEMAQAEMKGTIPSGMTKAEYAEFKFNSALIEEDDYDMLVMGRTQGKGCYCYVNGVLKTQVDKYAKNYRYLVMDNEAGLEHVARGTLPHVDTMLLISDCSRRGIQAVARVAEMIGEMELNPGQMGLIVNRAPGGELDEGVKAEIEKYGLKLLGVHSQDAAIIGDRMDTDIVAGIESGLDTLLVLSGVTSREELERFPYRPRLVLSGVGEIPPAP
jgi:CO dehydrogenase maturation factor